MRKANKNIDARAIADQIRGFLPRLQQEYGVRSLGLFGSCLRGEQKDGSDLDILVEFSTVPGMFRFLALERELSRLLGVPVDLVQKETLKPAIGKRIMNEVMQI
jgi:predicted nucleotidyltransferase